MQYSDCSRDFYEKQRLESGIPEDLWESNVGLWDGASSADAEFILGFLHRIKRINAGRLEMGTLRKLSRIEANHGLIFRGLNPRTGIENNASRIRFALGDIRYQSPTMPKEDKGKGKWSLFFPNVPRTYWKNIAKRHGETPLGSSHFWEWVREHPEVPIIITEGEKKALAAIAAGFVAISIPGIWMGRNGHKIINGIRTPKLHKELLLFCPFKPKRNDISREFIIAFDSDLKPSTIAQVQAARRDLGNCIYEVFQNVKQLYFPDTHQKVGLDDFLVAGGDLEDIIEKANFKAVNSGQYLRKNSSLKYQKAHQFTPDNTVYCRYLADILDEIYPKIDSDKRFLVGIKSLKNTGKTWSSIQWLKTHQIGSIGPGATNSLLRQKDNDFQQAGLPSLHIHDAAGLDFSLLLAPNYHLHFCYDSIIKLPDSAADDKILNMDEVGAALDHALIGNTCRSNRHEIVRKICTFLKRCRGVIAAEAEISDETVNFIASVGNFKPNEITKIENTYKPQHRDIRIWEGSYTCRFASRLRKSSPVFLRELMLREPLICFDIKFNPWDWRPLLTQAFKAGSKSLMGNQPICIVSDSRGFCHSLEKMLLDVSERIKKEEVEPTGSILTITRDTIGTEDVQKFLKDPTKYLAANRVAVLIFSPTLQSGVSINNRGYFSEIFGFRFHLDTQKFSQMIGRIRDEYCTGNIWSVPYLINDSVRFSAKNLMSDLVTRISSEAYRLNFEKNLAVASQSLQSDENYKVINDYTLRRIEIQKLDCSNLAENLYHHYAEQKSNISFDVCLALEQHEDRAEQYKEAKQEWLQEIGTRILNAEDIDWREAERISKSFKTSLTERAAAEKFYLKERYPGIDNTWDEKLIALLVEKCKRDLHKIELRWKLLNLEEARAHRLDDLKEKIMHGRLLPYLVSDWKSDFEKVALATDLGITQLLDGEWEANDPILKKMASKASHKSRSWLGGKMGKGGPLKLINRILGLFGYEMRRQSKGKGKARVYSFVPCCQFSKVKFDETEYNLWAILNPCISARNLARKESQAIKQQQSIPLCLGITAGTQVRQALQQLKPLKKAVVDHPLEKYGEVPQIPPIIYKKTTSSEGPKTIDIQSSQPIFPKTALISEKNAETKVNEDWYNKKSNDKQTPNLLPYKVRGGLDVKDVPQFWQAKCKEILKISGPIDLVDGRVISSVSGQIIWISKPLGGMISVPVDWIEPIQSQYQE